MFLSFDRQVNYWSLFSPSYNTSHFFPSSFHRKKFFWQLCTYANECKRRLTRAATNALSLPPFPCLPVFFPGNQASFWIYYSPARIIFAPCNPLSCDIVRDNPFTPGFERLFAFNSSWMRRVHTLLRTTVEFMLPSRSFPFNFIRNTRAIAILSMQIGWNGLASFLTFNPTCIPYVEEQILRLIVFELLGEELKRASVFATAKPQVNWKFFAILDEVYYFQRYEVLGWDWRAS